MFYYLFFFNDTATTEIYTLSLHDALPIFRDHRAEHGSQTRVFEIRKDRIVRSEEHTSELQSQFHLVCRLLLEKKKEQTEDDRPVLTSAKSDIQLPTPKPSAISTPKATPTP